MLKHAIAVLIICLLFRAAQAQQKASAPNPDKPFAARAASLTAGQIEVATLAIEKGSNDVKTLARILQEDHTKSNEQLIKIAQEKEIPITQEKTARQKGYIDRLKKLGGKTFDRAFVQTVLADHGDLLTLFKRESESGRDEQLKQFAIKTLPTLEHHVDMARDVAKKVGAASTTTTKAAK